MEYGLGGGLARGEHWAGGAAKDGRVKYSFCGGRLKRDERWAGGAAKDSCPEYGLGGVLRQGERVAGGAAKDGLCGGGLGRDERRGVAAEVG